MEYKSCTNCSLHNKRSNKFNQRLTNGFSNQVKDTIANIVRE